MPRLTTLQRMKTVLMQGLFVAAVTALIGFQGTGVAAHGGRLWSIVVHFEYQDGFEFDYVLERGGRAGRGSWRLRQVTLGRIGGAIPLLSGGGRLEPRSGFAVRRPGTQP